MKTRAVMLVLIALLSASTVYLALELRSSRSRCEYLDTIWNDMERIEEKADRWQAEARKTKERLEEFRTVLREQPILHEVYISHLKHRTGSEDPVGWIVADLMPRIDLIPQKGILGGTTRFDRVWILDDSHALAEVSDGHFVAWVVLAFEFDEGGGLDWEVVAHWS